MEDKPKRRPGRPPVWDFGKLAVGEIMVVEKEKAQFARKAVTMFKSRNPGWTYKSYTENGLYHIKRRKQIVSS